MDRRMFLTSTVASTVFAASEHSGVAAAAEGASSWIGKSKSELPTPALLVDLEALDGNIRKMADHCRAAKIAFRPHAKTHKSPDIAKRQLAAGAIGICAATVAEAEALVASGVSGVLLTSPLADVGKIARIVKLATRPGTVMLSIGHARQAQLLAEAVEAAGVSLEVLVDVDVGDRRTGIVPGEPAVELARQISRCKRLKVRGVQAYAGHASHTVGFAERDKVSRGALAKAVETRELLRRAGFEATMLSGGSTGTYNIDSTIEGMTELQVGSYVFMDMDYRRIGGRGGAVYEDFQPSLTVLTTVVSATYPDKVSVDAGTKAVDTTTTHRPLCKTSAGLLYTKAGDEFGAVTSEDGTPLPKFGDRLEFIVPHCDPNVNLYDRIYACRGDKVAEVWPIAARREPR